MMAGNFIFNKFKTIIIVILCESIIIVSCYPHSNWTEHLKKISSIGKSISYVSRADWNASPSNDILVSSYKPILLIMAKHTNTPHCYRKLACARSVKKLQLQSMADGFKDIQNSFLIDPHGNVFEGLGWFDLQSDHFDQDYRTIGFIGMENTNLTRNQKDAITDLFDEALTYEILNNNFHLCSTTDMVDAMKNIKIDLEMDMDNAKGKDITKEELRKLKEVLSMENIDCVRKAIDDYYEFH